MLQVNNHQTGDLSSTVRYEITDEEFESFSKHLRQLAENQCFDTLSNNNMWIQTERSSQRSIGDSIQCTIQYNMIEPERGFELEDLYVPVINLITCKLHNVFDAIHLEP